MSYLHFFSAISDTVTAFAVSGGYVALFIIILLEGIPLLGIAIPGHIIIITAGFLVSTGTLNVWWVFIITFIAATLGDYMSFVLGRRFGWPLLERLLPYFFISGESIIKARKFLEAHTGKALVLGRFNPVTRGLMPFIVGSSGMRGRSFWLWNTLGAVAWLSSSIAVGYMLGLGLNVISGWVSKAVIATIIGVILIIWGYRFVNARFHVFRKYELFALGLNLVSLVVFIRMLDDAFQVVPFMANFDLYINDLTHTFVVSGHQYLAHIAAWVDALSGTVMLSIITVIWGVYLAYTQKWRSVAVLMLTMGSTAFFVGIGKALILRIRPDNLILPYAPKFMSVLFDSQSIYFEPSFPSGHAALAAAFFTVLAYLLSPKIRSWVKREMLIVACVISALAVGLSRLVLSVHWASDVIAGWSLGIFCATASILFVRYVGAMLTERATTHLGGDLKPQ